MKKTKKRLVYLGAVISFILIVGGFFFYHFFYSMESLPGGELIQQVDSPTREYTINIYYVKGSLTTGDSIRGEVLINKTGNKRNLYWGYHEREGNVIWLDNTIVVINGRSLDIFNDYYDWRNK